VRGGACEDSAYSINLADFPASTLALHGVSPLHPDPFLCQLMDEEEERLLVGG
jgi:hypothetical protein